MLSGRGRLALAAWTATLLTATALLPLTDGLGWYLQAVFAVSVLTGAGVVGRRVPLARPVTVLAQTVLAVMLLTLMSVAGQAVAGVVPGPRALAEFGVLLDAGVEDVQNFSTPAPVTDGIRLLLLLGVVTVAVLVDALAVTYRSAAPAGLPLLALYSVAAGIDDGNGWLLFLLVGCGYLALLLAEGRERLVQWGRVFGSAHGSRPPSAAGAQPVTPMRTGRRLGAVTLGLALIAPVALPSLSGGLLEGAGTGPGEGPGRGTVSAVNPVVQLQQSLNQPDDREVLRYRAAGEGSGEQYLRFVALDRFDGVMWTAGKRQIGEIPGKLPQPAGMTLGDLDVRTVELEVEAREWYRQQWLPMPYPASEVEVDSREWKFEPVGRTVVGSDGRDTGGAEYRLKVYQVRPTPEQLMNAGEPPAELRREFTALPGDFPAEVRRKAAELTRDDATAYGKAVSLQRFFQGSFTYETTVDLDRNDPRAIVKFLQERKGFCVHFSFAMASMARSLGIPARIAVGFTPGKAENGMMSVGLKDAHAWPELYFEGIGWTRFEPTPTRGTVPGYSLGESSSTTPRNQPRDPQATAGSSAPAAPGPSTSGCPSSLRRLDPAGCGQAQPGALTGPGTKDPWLLRGETLFGGAVLLAALVALVTPALWRRRLRRTRLARGAPALAAWTELSDSAWDLGIPPDDALTPRAAMERLVRVGPLSGDAAAAAERVAGAIERVLFAPGSWPAAGVAGDVRRVVDALTAAALRGVRLRARLAPPSVAQVFQGWAAAWSARAERWSDAVREAAGRLRPRRQGAS
ncbi:transglutaminaseTgpA domain-containing protein [Streptomyces polyrhachis]|uniref:TransglutaminaseTgpA domain-containing protein n=1 Tax=Streptomyces polyrhachis TaxID=1282885 RepID=A0ABW2G7F9_9ACTN